MGKEEAKMKPLKIGHILNQQYQIKEVVATGGNSYVYLVEHKAIGQLLIKEYIYGLYNSKYSDGLERLEDGQIVSNDLSLFAYWKEHNEQLSYKEQQQLKILRDHGFAFYEASLQPFLENNTLYVPILNSRGTTLNQISINNVNELYHYTLIILKAIAELHQKGFIHLDLSPDNLLITPYDVGFLLDFGSMKALTHLDNEIMCKEEYASKEVLERVYYRDNIYFKSGELGVWSDIYSIGKVMLYLENKCLDRNTYLKELATYHEVARKASKEKIKKRYSAISEMYDLLSKENEHMAYEGWKLRQSILDKAKNIEREFRQPKNYSQDFYYKNRNQLFIGREYELNQLEIFEKQDLPFSYMTLTAPGGQGKSALVYHYVSLHLFSSSYKYIYLNGSELSAFEPMDLTHLGFPVMVIIDYVSGYYYEIASFLEKAIQVEGQYPLKVIFIERGNENSKYPIWMEQLKPYTQYFTQFIAQPIYFKNLYLEKLTTNELTSIINHKKAMEVYQKLVEIDRYERPLYALMLREMYNDDEISIENITYIDVLEYIIDKEKHRISSLCHQEQLNEEEWNRYYALATMCFTLDFEDIELKISDPLLKRMLTKLNMFDDGFILHGLQPDLIGEYFIFDYFKQLRKQKIKEFMATAWSIDKAMVQRTLTNMESDFGEYYRDKYLNFDLLYYPYHINQEYHHLLKYCLLIPKLRQQSDELLSQHFEYYIIDGKFIEYNGNSKQLFVPSGVKELGQLQGIHVPQIEELYLSDEVQTIEARAFFYHKNLRKIVCGKNLSIIGESAFHFCEKLKEVILNEGLYQISERAFYETPIEYIQFPSSLEVIESRAFISSLYIDSFVIPSTLKSIGLYAFWGTHIKVLDFKAVDCEIDYGCFANSQIEKVNLAVGMETIPSGMFYGTCLENIKLPSTIKIIGESAFKNSQLTHIELNSGLQRIEAEAFYRCHLTSLEFPSSLRFIERGAFNDALDIDTLVIPGRFERVQIQSFIFSKINHLILEEGITSIEDNAFRNTTLSSVQFPSSLKKIGSFAFSDCINLSAIVLPKNIKEINYGAFDHCPIKEVYLPNHLKDIRTAFDIDTKLIYPPLPNKKQTFKEILESMGQPKNGIVTSKYPDESPFEFSLEDSTIFTSLSYHGEEHLVIPEHYKEIDSITYSKTNPLKSIQLSEGLEVIKSGAMMSLNIEEIEIPSTVKTISSFAFSDCTKLKRVLFKEGIEYISDYAFEYCTSLEDFNLPKSIKKIGDYAFLKTNFTSIEFPKDIEEIGSIEKTQLKEIVIPPHTKLVCSRDHGFIFYISNNPQLERVVFHESNIGFASIRMKNNPKLKVVEFIPNEQIKDYMKINELCEIHEYPIKATSTSYLIDASKGDPIGIYRDFIRDDFLIHQLDNWMK